MYSKCCKLAIKHIYKDMRGGGGDKDDHEQEHEYHSMRSGMESTCIIM